jgi:hypothetical protein
VAGRAWLQTAGARNDRAAARSPDKMRCENSAAPNDNARRTDRKNPRHQPRALRDHQVSRAALPGLSLAKGLAAQTRPLQTRGVSRPPFVPLPAGMTTSIFLAARKPPSHAAALRLRRMEFWRGRYPCGRGIQRRERPYPSPRANRFPPPRDCGRAARARPPATPLDQDKELNL